MPMEPARAPEPGECAAYIAELAAELATMARGARLARLAAALDAAVAQARHASSSGRRRD